MDGAAFLEPVVPGRESGLKKQGAGAFAPALTCTFPSWRGRDLNPRPSGYEPDELPDCSTPRRRHRRYHRGPVSRQRAGRLRSRRRRHPGHADPVVDVVLGEDRIPALVVAPVVEVDVEDVDVDVVAVVVEVVGDVVFVVGGGFLVVVEVFDFDASVSSSCTTLPICLTS